MDEPRQLRQPAAPPHGLEGLPPAMPAATPSARRALVSSSWLLLESLLRLGLTAVVSFWIARQLGPADFGLLNVASALAAILFAAASLGLEVPTVVRLARGDDAGAVLGSVLGLRFAAAIAALLLAAGATFTMRPGDARAQTVMLIVALSVLGYVPMVLDCAFKAAVEAGPPARARMATTLLAALAKVAVLITGAGVVAMAWTVLLEALLASLLMGWAWWRHRPAPIAAATGAKTRVVLHFDSDLAAMLMRQSWPLLGAAAAATLQLKSDVVLLGHLTTDLQAGHYALAQKLSEVLYIVPVVLVDSVYPMLARRTGSAVAAGDEKQDQLMFDLAGAAGVLCSAACVLLAGPLIVGVFGTAYEDTVSLWQWHGLTCTAVALDVSRQRWLVAHGLQHQALHSALLGACLACGLNLLLIPVYGAPAAAAVAVLAWWGAGLLATVAWHHDDRTRALAGLQWRALWPWQRLARRLIDALKTEEVAAKAQKPQGLQP